MPATATAGKSSVTVKLVPTAGAPPWSAQRYDVISVVPAAFDQAVTEGENLPYLSGIQPYIEPNCCHIFYSGGAQSRVDATAVGQSVTYGLDVPYDGAFTVYATMTRSPWYGTAKVSVDGVVQGAEIDAYDPRILAGAEQQVLATGLTRGRHTLTFTVTGKNKAAGGYTFGIDLLRVTTTPTLVYEAEGQQVASASSTYGVQADCCGVSWSGGAQMLMTAQQVNSSITLRFWVPADGSYALTVDQTTAADYGIGGFSVDGVGLGGEFDLYSSAVALHSNDTIGQPTLTAGYHTLTMTVTDRNAASTGYQMGLDDFLLMRV